MPPLRRFLCSPLLPSFSLSLSLGGALVLTMLSGAAAPARAAQPRGVPFGCDAPAGHKCAFTIVHADGRVEAYGMGAGERYTLPAVPTMDRYVVTVDHAPIGINDCPAAAQRGVFCKAAVVRREYNN